ncbi:hypothetical protein BC829DRAFT_412763 [Chytridium lagenaria]|nr:hypothetical protein BC829DRAFT_412763 [Chytridium lagenaria]
MYVSTAIIAAVAALSQLVAPSAAVAVERRSNYPPGYVVSTSCQEVFPVKVCAINKGYGSPRVRVTYNKSGYLWNFGSPLSAWVKVNGASGIFGNFTADLNDQGAAVSATYSIGEFRDVKYCYQGTVAENSTYVPPYIGGGYGRCPVTPLYPLLPGAVNEGYLGWFYNPAPASEVALVSQSGTWNVEVAVTNAVGNWDSKFGANYRFTLN